MADNETPRHAGDPHHRDHDDFLAELGVATYAASRVAGICFDILRVWGGVPSDELYSDPLGRLEDRLKKLSASQVGVVGLDEFLAVLTAARETRNDLLHALPSQEGLHRRKSNDPHYVRNFLDIDDLTAVVHELDSATATGNRVLYSDDGAAVRAWADASLAIAVDIWADGVVDSGEDSD